MREDASPASRMASNRRHRKLVGKNNKEYITISKLLRTSVEEANMKDGKVDIDSLEAIAFDPYTHGYYKVGGRVGEAFKDGAKLK